MKLIQINRAATDNDVSNTASLAPAKSKPAEIISKNWTKTPDGFSKIVTGPALDNLTTYAILEKLGNWPWKVSVESGPIFGTARRFYFGQNLQSPDAESAQEEADIVLAARGWS